MENSYTFYSYKFVEVNDEGDWTQGVQVTVTDMDAAQDWLYQLFGKTQTLFHVQKDEGEGAKKYTCEVYGNDHRIVALRLLNIKEQSYWKLVKNPNDPMGDVNGIPKDSDYSRFHNLNTLAAEICAFDGEAKIIADK